ncbi:Protein spear1 [Sarracenia purpurea var. burkii]
MGSSNSGDPNLGNERSGSSRKGKKSNSDKPKQPQRGLGVAQLEKIRLHNQMGCLYLPSLHAPYPTNLNQEDMNRLQTGYSVVQSSSSSSYTSLLSSSSDAGIHGSQNIMVR